MFDAYIVGYSFGDEHINNVIYEGLRINTRLHVSAFMYRNEEFEKALVVAKQYRRLALYGPEGACIGGLPGKWIKPSREKRQEEEWPFWEERENRFTLGDFSAFVRFLEVTVGISSSDVVNISPVNEALFTQGEKGI